MPSASVADRPPTTLLNQGIAMVRHLAHSPRSLGVTEIAKQMNLPKSSTFRILTILGELGFVQKGEASGRYSVSPEIFSFVYELTHHFAPTKRFETIMIECAERWRCSVYISMLSGTHSYVVSAMGPTGGTLALGSSCPAYASSAGKIIVAALDESQWPSFAPQPDDAPLTAYTNHEAERFYRELRVAREQGVAWNLRESTESDVSVAALVPEANQPPRLAAALLIPYKDMLTHDKERLAERVRELAQRLTEEAKASPARPPAILLAPSAVPPSRP